MSFIPQHKRYTTVNSQSSVGGSSYLRLIHSRASVFMFSRHQKINIQGSLRNISNMTVKCGINDRNEHDKRVLEGPTVNQLLASCLYDDLFGAGPDSKNRHGISAMADNRMSTATPQQLKLFCD